MVVGNTPVLVHNCDGTTPLYRFPRAGNGQAELDGGLDPANHPRTYGEDGQLIEDGAAHFGDENMAKFFQATHGNRYEPTGYRVDVPTKWLEDNGIVPLEGEDYINDLPTLEYPIPHELFDEFNQFPRTRWSPNGS